MSLPDHERLTELFARYLELEPAEREPFLDRECGSEPAVRNELLSLAGYHESPVSIAKTGAAAERGLAAVDADPPQVGPYRVFDRIGAGGMGVVYRAEQEQPINRTIAVKLIRHRRPPGRLRIVGERLILSDLRVQRKNAAPRPLTSRMERVANLEIMRDDDVPLPRRRRPPARTKPGFSSYVLRPSPAIQLLMRADGQDRLRRRLRFR